MASQHGCQRSSRLGKLRSCPGRHRHDGGSRFRPGLLITQWSHGIGSELTVRIPEAEEGLAWGFKAP